MLTTENLKDTINYAKKYLGIPYIWAGNSRFGLDCSGLIQQVAFYAGIAPSYDMSSQMLYEYWAKQEGWFSTKEPGAFIFYGKSIDSITHISFVISDTEVIESGGGDSFTTHESIARAKNAKVRIKSINHRRDIVAAIRPLWIRGNC